MTDLATFLEDLSERYLNLHRAKEEAFWDTRMGLADRHQELVEADLALREFLADSDQLAELRDRKGRGDATPAQSQVLDGWILMFSRNQIEDPAARELQREVANRENRLQKARGEMDLGYRDADGRFVAASSVELANHLRTHPDAELRRACFLGLRSIEDFALENGYAEIVKGRNRFARMLGYDDYYDYKVQWAEGFDKKTLFRYLDDLELRTRDRARTEIERLKAEKGKDAVEPWNFVYHTWGGSLTEERDPYFQFEDALERWAVSFARLGIRFRNARITLDLVDRKGKYENGFMHGPVPAFRRRGEWLPAEINFTANALPGQSGAGYRAAQTLFHEGGHAAHFSNIVQDAPCFSQEFAPTSVALAETQSMFCDSFLGDADWQTRYCRNREGQAIPFELIERQIRATHPFAAQGVRQMLVVCYAEKALYEMSDDELTGANILKSFREIERKITQLPGGNPRPTLAVPHLLSWDASAYYHGYVLAEMAVYQTRAHLRRKHGHLLDNPAVGKDLAESYWRPGNSRNFLDLVRDLTGSEFSADALVEHVSQDTEEAVREARASVDALEQRAVPEVPIDLDLRLRVIHGQEVVVEEGKSPSEVAETYRDWLVKNWRETPASTA
ncbi:MAG: peptidase [Gemmatimonadota bacterium]|nr:MAG: peptidase [Gemmatimonadota bacterium]